MRKARDRVHVRAAGTREDSALSGHHLMERVAPENIPDRHHVPALQDASSPHRSHQDRRHHQEDPVGHGPAPAPRGFAAPVACAPEPWPARPPPAESGGEGGDWLNGPDLDKAGWGRLFPVVESPSSGPGNPDKTRSIARLGRAQNRINALR
jgi:hypothetical protein